MVPSFLQLLRRDHDELEHGLRALVRPRTNELRDAIDGVRLGLLAHVEAEDVVVDVAVAGGDHPRLARAVAARRADHRDQERALGALLRSSPGSSLWRDRALHLIALVRQHRATSEMALGAALEVEVDAERVGRLAGAYATERMRQIGMLMPSAPIAVPEELRGAVGEPELELALAIA
jgi:hypothetical protein